MGLLWYGTSEMMDLTGHLVEAVLDIIFYIIVLVIIALDYKATAKKAVKNFDSKRKPKMGLCIASQTYFIEV